MLYEYANGIDDSEVNYKVEKPKGIGHSITLTEDLEDIEKLEEVLLALTEQTTFRLRKYELLANTVSVQLRSNNFQDTSHKGKLLSATSSTKEIYAKAKELLHSLYHKPMKIRLIGVRVENLTSKEDLQLSLFNDNTNKKQEKLDNALDKIKEKYGYNAIKRAGDMRANDILKLKDIKK